MDFRVGLHGARQCGHNTTTTGAAAAYLLGPLQLLLCGRLCDRPLQRAAQRCQQGDGLGSLCCGNEEAWVIDGGGRPAATDAVGQPLTGPNLVEQPAPAGPRRNA